jgi:hypothetical protein
MEFKYNLCSVKTSSYEEFTNHNKRSIYPLSDDLYDYDLALEFLKYYTETDFEHYYWVETIPIKHIISKEEKLLSRTYFLKEL